jgi:hypothetical protein
MQIEGAKKSERSTEAATARAAPTSSLAHPPCPLPSPPARKSDRSKVSALLRGWTTGRNEPLGDGREIHRNRRDKDSSLQTTPVPSTNPTIRISWVLLAAHPSRLQVPTSNDI